MVLARYSPIDDHALLTKTRTLNSTESMLELGLGLGLGLGLRLGLVRVKRLEKLNSCMIKEWFKQNSAAESLCASGS